MLGHVTWFDTTLMGWVAGHRFPLGDFVARVTMAVGTDPLILAAIALMSVAYVVVRHRSPRRGPPETR
jgi:hypothetical protein